MWPCLTLGYREVKSNVYPNVEISRYWWTRVSLPHCIGQSMWLGEEAEFRVTHVHTTGDKLAMDQEAERSRREFAWTQPLPPAPGTAKDFLAGLFGFAENPARLGCLQAEDSFCLWQGISPHSINKSHMGFRPCGCMLACLTFFCSYGCAGRRAAESCCLQWPSEVRPFQVGTFSKEWKMIFYHKSKIPSVLIMERFWK